MADWKLAEEQRQAIYARAAQVSIMSLQQSPQLYVDKTELAISLASGAQAKALIADIEKHFWKAWDGSPYLLSFGEEVKHTCISLDWDWWQELRQEVEK